MNRRGDYRLLTLSRRRSSFAPKTRHPVGPAFLFGTATFLASQASLLHRQASAFALARVQVHLVHSICSPFVYGNTKFNILQAFYLPIKLETQRSDATFCCAWLRTRSFKFIGSKAGIWRTHPHHLSPASTHHLAIRSWSVESQLSQSNAICKIRRSNSKTMCNRFEFR